MLSLSFSDSDDDKPLITWVGNKYTVGTRLRKFENNKYYNGRVVSFDRDTKQ